MTEAHTLTVAGFVRDDGACGKYRVSQPLTKCDEAGYFISKLIMPGDNNDTIIDKLSGAHVVVIPRPYDDHMLELIKRLKKNDVKVVVEHDDNMFDISPWSIHYQEFGTENVQVNLNGEVKHLWRNGVNIDLRENKARIDGFKQAIEIADMVQVTQPILARVYQQFNDNVICLPNCVDGKVWQKLPLQPRDTVRLMWSGGSSHYQDVYILKDVLPKICKKYPQVQVVIMGCQWKAIFGAIPPEQYEFHDWVPTEAYPYKHAGLDIDISLIPLEDNQFNSCKSHVKLIEQSFLSVPSITSLAHPYRDFYSGNNMVMSENNDQSWIEAISRLVEDAPLRRQIGFNANQTAREQFDAAGQAKLWAEAYSKVVGA